MNGIAVQHTGEKFTARAKRRTVQQWLKDRARQGEREIPQILGLRHRSIRLPGNTRVRPFYSLVPSHVTLILLHRFVAVGTLPAIVDAFRVTQKQVANAEEFYTDFCVRFFLANASLFLVSPLKPADFGTNNK